MSQLCEAWARENAVLKLKGQPTMTLKEFQESIHYAPDDSLVFLAGVDEVWLKGYLERIKQRALASKAYYAAQPISIWVRLGEFARILAIVIFIALLISFIFLLLY